MLWRRRRLVLSLTLCLVVVLFATLVVRTYMLPPATVQSTPQAAAATATPAVPSTYLFGINSFPPGLRAGQQLSLHWVPSLEPRGSPADVATEPVAVVCTFALYSPYRLATSAGQAMDAQNLFTEHPATKPAYAAPPLDLT